MIRVRSEWKGSECKKKSRILCTSDRKGTSEAVAHAYGSDFMLKQRTSLETRKIGESKPNKTLPQPREQILSINLKRNKGLTE
jgi:hypothetical protein